MCCRIDACGAPRESKRCTDKQDESVWFTEARRIHKEGVGEARRQFRGLEKERNWEDKETNQRKNEDVNEREERIIYEEGLNQDVFIELGDKIFGRNERNCLGVYFFRVFLLRVCFFRLYDLLV